jgi:hypothetical protein
MITTETVRIIAATLSAVSIAYSFYLWFERSSYYDGEDHLQPARNWLLFGLVLFAIALAL